MTDSIQKIFLNAIETNVAPGFAAAIGLIQYPLQFHFTAGTIAGIDSPKATSETIYDLASLTKVLCTTIVTAQAIVDKKLSLDECPWPNWPGVSIKSILNHTAGLPAWKPLYPQNPLPTQWGEGSRERGINISKEELIHPGEKTLYSDLGFIALGQLLEDRYGIGLEKIFNPPSQLFFRINPSPLTPLRRGERENQFAPTGHCKYRNRQIQGEVNDANAAFLGGIAAHAGLFGNLHAVECAVRYLTKAITLPTTEVEHILYRFAHSSGERALGFDKATSQGATGGFLSKSAVGHLGFTGTSFFIDPEQFGGSYFILLSNRSFANQDPKTILPVRQQFHQTASQLLNETFTTL